MANPYLQCKDCDNQTYNLQSNANAGFGVESDLEKGLWDDRSHSGEKKRDEIVYSTNVKSNYDRKEESPYAALGAAYLAMGQPIDQENVEKARELKIDQEEQTRITFSIGGVELGGSLDNLVTKNSELQRIEQARQQESI